MVVFPGQVLRRFKSLPEFYDIVVVQKNRSPKLYLKRFVFSFFECLMLEFSGNGKYCLDMNESSIFVDVIHFKTEKEV